MQPSDARRMVELLDTDHDQQARPTVTVVLAELGSTWRHTHSRTNPCPDREVTSNATQPLVLEYAPSELHMRGTGDG